jgi:NitT/TauT family transport system permease protein
VRTLLGFSLAFAFGVAYGIASGRNRAFRHATSLVFQVVLFANTLVIILWGLAILGNTNNLAVAVITAIAVAPTVSIYVRDVVTSVDVDVIEMGEAYKATVRSRILDLYLPFLAPALLAAGRIGFSQAWKVVMLSEVFGFPAGIGWEIRTNFISFNMDQLIAWLAIFVVTLLLIEQIFRAAEYRAMPWRVSTSVAAN